MRIYVVTETQDNSHDADTYVAGAFTAKFKAHALMNDLRDAHGGDAYRWTIQIHEIEVTE